MADTQRKRGASAAAAPGSSSTASTPAPQSGGQAQDSVASVASLTGSVINLSLIRDAAKREFGAMLDSVQGPKLLILDPDLVGPLGLVVDAKFLKSKEVIQMFKLSNEVFSHPCRNIFFVVRPTPHMMRMVARLVKRLNQEENPDGGGGGGYEFSLYCTPRKTLIGQHILDEEGVTADVKVAELKLYLIPYDDDVISTEVPTAFKDMNLDGDFSSIFHIAKALMTLQALYGPIPKVKAKGRNAKMVFEVMQKLMQETGNEGLTGASEIDSIILIDRMVDPITPLLTPLTYEGLVDEFFGIHYGLLENTFDKRGGEAAAGAGAAGGGEDGGKKPASKIALNANDKVFADIRDLNFVAIGKVLTRKAQYVDENYKQRHNLKTAAELREFYQKLPSLSREHISLGIHINVAQEIKTVANESPFRKLIAAEHLILQGADEKENLEYIEDLINSQQPLAKVLRLLCLLSLTTNGLKPKIFDFFRAELIQTYGFELIPTLDNLEKVGLLMRQDGKASSWFNWSQARKNFNLWVDNINEAEPDNTAYVHSGYAPLSVRLVEAALRPGGWKSAEDMLRQLPGPTVDTAPDVFGAPTSMAAAATSSARKVTLVFFIGGCTYSEINALRFLSDNMVDNGGRDFIVGTTNIINGKTFLSSLYEKIGRMGLM